MSEDLEIVRFAYNETDMKTTSKSFIYVWKINNASLFLNKRKNKYITSENTAFSKNNEDTQLWKIKLSLKICQNYYTTGEKLAAEVIFDAKAAKIICDHFKLYIYIVNTNKTEVILHESSTHNELNSDQTVKMQCEMKETSPFISSNLNGMLAYDGSLTLKFQLIFNTVETSHNFIDSTNSLSCTKRQQLNAIASMFNDEKFSDTKIFVNGKVFHVHKFMLATHSSVFAAMFQHDMKERKENVIEIKDADHKVVEEMLRFIYTTEVKNMEIVSKDLLVLADKYNIEKLMSVCEEFLIRDLKMENMDSLLTHAEKYGCKKLKEFVTNFIKSRQREKQCSK